MEVTSLAPDEIVIGNRLRALNPETVAALKESIKQVGGIKVPLSVRFLSNEEGFALVAGRHRLQAAIELGLARVPVREETGSELDARLWEIAENLHRAELSALERDEHIAEWVALVKERDKERLLNPVGTPTLSDGRRASPQHLPHGTRNAARELGIPPTNVHKAITVAGLSKEAKEEARVLHLDDNQSAMLNAAKHDSKEDQIRALREHAVKRVSFSEANSSEKRIEKFQMAAKSLSPEEFAIADEWFTEFRAERGAAVFDRSTMSVRA